MRSHFFNQKFRDRGKNLMTEEVSETLYLCTSHRNRQLLDGFTFNVVVEIAFLLN